MVYKIVFTKNAEKDLDLLKGSVVKRILTKLDYFVNEENPLHYAKLLKGTKNEVYRFRVGDYRVVFKLDRKTRQLIILVVLRIAYRKDIYR